MSSALILAAGASDRMGNLGPKALLALPSGVTFVRHILDQCRAAAIKDIVVVTSSGLHLQLTDQLNLPASLVINPNSHLGMFSSIQFGMNRLALNSTGTLIWPVDTPLVYKETLLLLFNQPADATVPTYGGRGGHPVFFSRSTYSTIAERATTGTLRDVIFSLGDRVLRLPVQDPGVTADIDTPEQYAQLSD